MLACARLGAVHSVVFGGFAPRELAVRIDDAQPKVRGDRVVRNRAHPGRRVQADARRGPGAGRRTSPARGDHAAAAGDAPRWPSRATWTGTSAMRAGRTEPAECVEVAATDPLYVLYTSGTTGKPEGHRPRQRRPRGRDGVVAAERLRRPRRARSGGRPPTSAGSSATPTSSTRRCSPGDHGPLRGQAGRHPRRGRVLAGGGRARRRGPVHRADGDPGDQEGGPRRRRCWPEHDLSPLRTLFLAGERLDPDTYHWATEQLGVPGHRPLVADRDRLADRGQPARPGADADQAGVADGADAGLRRARSSTSGGEPSPPGQEGAICVRLPLPPGHAADAVGRRRALRGVVPVRVRRLLPLRRRRLHRRGRLPVRHGPHRRRHQRGRAPAVHRVDGGGTRRAPGGGRVRGDRGRRPAQGPGAARFRGAQGRRRGRPDDVRRELVAAVRDEIGAVAAFARSTSCRRCRRPARGKILRKTMREIADGKDADGARRRSRTPRCWTGCARPLRPLRRRRGALDGDQAADTRGGSVSEASPPERACLEGRQHL